MTWRPVVQVHLRYFSTIQLLLVDLVRIEDLLPDSLVFNRPIEAGAIARVTRPTFLINSVEQRITITVDAGAITSVSAG